MHASPLENRTESRIITIHDRGTELTLDYAGLEQFHQGDSWFGCCAGFRALQMAAEIFASQGGWDRHNLYIVSAHPGPGVRDAIDYVTGCVRLKRFRLLDEQSAQQGCSRHMKFIWWLSNGHRTVRVQLRHDFVPEAFYALLGRLQAKHEQVGDRQAFDRFKAMLSDQLWDEPLTGAFQAEVSHTPLNLGELPDA